MHVIAQQVFLKDAERGDQQEGVGVEHERMQLGAQGALRVAEMAHDEQQRPDADDQHAADQQHGGMFTSYWSGYASIFSWLVGGD